MCTSNNPGDIDILFIFWIFVWSIFWIRIMRQLHINLYILLMTQMWSTHIYVFEMFTSPEWIFHRLYTHIDILINTLIQDGTISYTIQWLYGTITYTFIAQFCCLHDVLRNRIMVQYVNMQLMCTHKNTILAGQMRNQILSVRKWYFVLHEMWVTASALHLIFVKCVVYCIP